MLAITFLLGLTLAQAFESEYAWSDTEAFGALEADFDSEHASSDRELLQAGVTYPPPYPPPPPAASPAAQKCPCKGEVKVGGTASNSSWCKDNGLDVATSTKAGQLATALSKDLDKTGTANVKFVSCDSSKPAAGRRLLQAGYQVDLRFSVSNISTEAFDGIKAKLDEVQAANATTASTTLATFAATLSTAAPGMTITTVAPEGSLTPVAAPPPASDGMATLTLVLIVAGVLVGFVIGAVVVMFIVQKKKYGSPPNRVAPEYV